MCTVTYLSTPDGYILTSNRDEDPNRAKAEIPGSYDPNRPDLIYPRDPLGHGSWIVAHKNGSIRCLLNGAFEFHRANPPYRHSRGLVPIHSYDFDNADQFHREYSAKGLEPFTLIWKGPDGLYEFRWDGKKLHKKDLDTSGNYIWSSATLYSEEVRTKRKVWFQEWLEKNDSYGQDKILYFHRFGGAGNTSEDLVMERPGLVPKTISITSYSVGHKGKNLTYEDLISRERISKHL